MLEVEDYNTRNRTIQLTWLVISHRGPKRKLRAGYRAPSQTDVLLQGVFIVERGIARFLCAMRVFDVRHHPHPLGYRCAKFRFFRGLRCWASPWTKIA